MYLWRHLRQLYGTARRWGNQGHLAVVLSVLAGLVPFAGAVLAFVLTADQRLWSGAGSWTGIALRLFLGLGAPLILVVLWYRSRPSRRAIRVYDWLGAGVLAYSVFWLSDALKGMVDHGQMGLWGQFLLEISPALWAVAGTTLLIIGTVYASQELTSERRERQRLEALMDFTRRITSMDYQTILNDAVRHLHHLLQADACVLYLWNDAEQVLVPVAGHHDEPVYSQAYITRMMAFKCPLGFGITGWVMRTGEPYISGDVMADPMSQAVPGFSRDEKSCLLAPIQVEGRRLGVVRLTRRGLNQFDQDDLDLAMSFANQAAMVIEHGRIVKELSDLSITDSMTGLHNQRYFHQLLAVEVDRSGRYGSPLSLVLIDSDSLKQVNDAMGHQRGDEFIRIIGQVIKEHIRLSDHAFRYAGDEFLLLLPNTGPEEAFAVADRVRGLIEEKCLDAGMRGTVSMGIAVLPVHAHDGESLLASADRALYESKRRGKNRATIADPLGA